MSAHPYTSPAESARFVTFWLHITGTSHITLTAIEPDGPTITDTFEDYDEAVKFIERYQADGQNIYFQVNETPKDCRKKPSKAVMVAGLCRHADIDPDDDNYPYHEERIRLHKLAEILRSDSNMPPTAILDSGNGIQPLWVVHREVLHNGAVEHIEAQNRAIEAAFGAVGTHNIDRLLRLPGTANYPNAVKKSRGRSITRSWLVHSSPMTYSVADAAQIGTYWAEKLKGSNLIRVLAKTTKTQFNRSTISGADTSRSAKAFRKGAAMRRAGATFEQMCETLRQDPETADWCREKGDTNGGRELRRVWDNVGAAVEATNALMQEFNRRFMLVNEAGKAVIYAPQQDPILHRRYYDRITASALELLYRNRRIQVGIDAKGNAIMKSAATVWLDHPDRHQYVGGIIFDPSGKPAPRDVLNLWNGFAIAPAKGDWSLLRQHIELVICSGNQKHFCYLMGWLARIIQSPAEQGEVAVVLRGNEGCGKGTLAKALMRILGQHGMAVSSSKHLVGHFNQHLRDCVFLFADEAFYAGDPQVVGTLKSLISEPYIPVEGKNMNVVLAPNFLHILMASNNEWVVPASLQARRFLMLDVPDAHRRDIPYFRAIWEQMEAGGYAAMLHDLLHYDLTGFDVRDVPETKALQHQKKLSLPVPERWWQDCLSRGYVHESKFGLEETFSEWIGFLGTDLLFNSYRDYAARHRERHPLTRENFGRFMVQMGAAGKRMRKVVVGEHMVETIAKDRLGESRPGPRTAEVIVKEMAHGYNLGTLEKARAAFTAATNLEIDWDSPGTLAPEATDYQQAAE